MNQNQADSGIPIRFNRKGKRSNRRRVDKHKRWGKAWEKAEVDSLAPAG
jgi:hypothetical protein